MRRAGAGHRYARRRFAGIDDVIAGNGVDGDRWRGAIDAVFMRCRGAVAVDVSHPHLGAGNGNGLPRFDAGRAAGER